VSIGVAIILLLGINSPLLNGKTWNPMELSCVVGNDHAILRHGMCSNHEFHIADGFTLGLERLFNLRVLMCRIKRPRPDIKS